MLMKNSIGHFSIGEVFKTKGEDHKRASTPLQRVINIPTHRKKYKKKAGDCLAMSSSYKVVHSQR